MVNNDKNVYILGAGFSAEAGIPLMNDFLDKARHLWQTIYKDEFDPVFSHLHSLLPAGRVIAHKLDNIEELFGVLELELDIFRGDDVKKEELSKIRDSLLGLIIKTIFKTDTTKNRDEWKLNHGSKPKSLPFLNYQPTTAIKPPDKFIVGTNQYFIDIYAYFAALVTRYFEGQPCDSIITFNYDVVLENALKCFPCQIDFGIPLDKHPNTGEKIIRLLKLHGSVGFKKYADSDKHYFEHKDYSQFSSLIVPPSWNKSKYRDLVMPIWTQAYKELKEARRIIVIGYSLPETDTYFKNLLTLSLAANQTIDKFIVVDTSDEAGEKFRKLIYPHFHRNFVHIGSNKRGLRDFLFRTYHPNVPSQAVSAYTRQEINEL